MWCRKCNIETNEKLCPICGSETVEDLPVEIYWCKSCHTPVIQTVKQSDRGFCPICGKKPGTCLQTCVRYFLKNAC